MSTLITVLLLIVSILLIVVVLIQNSKGGGLATGNAGSQIMGVKRTTDFLEKTTWTLAILLVSLALITKITGNTQQAGPEATDTELREKIDNIQAPAPAAPAPGTNAPGQAAPSAQPANGVPTPAANPAPAAEPAK